MKAAGAFNGVPRELRTRCNMQLGVGGANMAETPKLELVDIQPIILKLEGPFFSVRVHTKDAQYPEIDLVVQRRFLNSLKDEIIEMLEDFPQQAED
jgi:hypothetical protein